jgi:hypothetical protein
VFDEFSLKCSLLSFGVPIRAGDCAWARRRWAGGGGRLVGRGWVAAISATRLCGLLDRNLCRQHTQRNSRPLRHLELSSPLPASSGRVGRCAGMEGSGMPACDECRPLVRAGLKFTGHHGEACSSFSSCPHTTGGRRGAAACSAGVGVSLGAFDTVISPARAKEGSDPVEDPRTTNVDAEDAFAFVEKNSPRTRAAPKKQRGGVSGKFVFRSQTAMWGHFRPSVSPQPHHSTDPPLIDSSSGS